MSITLFAASRRRPGLTRAEYYRYIEHYHGIVSRIEPSHLTKYIQNHVIDGAFGLVTDTFHQCKTQDREAVVQLEFAHFADLVTDLDTGEEASRASLDGKFFADEPTNILVMAEPTEIPVETPMPKFNAGLGEPGHGALNVLHYVKRKEGIYPNDFQKMWRQAHDDAYASSPYAREMFRKVVAWERNRVNDNDGAARKHFRMVNPPTYDLIVSITLDTIEQVGAFRQYVDAMQSSNQSFANWSESFYLYTRPVRIIENT